ncbi:MAG TPA: TIGR00730 family Rossman fold protein [Turneriella sp.]|nr:TIGR00730 family Rossman fold protein [Turneriella sp.]
MAKKRNVSKAYQDPEFMTSVEARSLRILSEYLMPLTRFEKMRVKDTIVFFGSARIPSPVEVKAERARLVAQGKTDDAAQRRFDARVRYYKDAVRLSYRLTNWSKALPADARRFLICSGGGPGIMEAANRGAAYARGLSVGMNIALPFEQIPNPYITQNLNFDFHYFFMRKFWLTNMAKALVAFPGGFGTFDELFEILTLVQTHKMAKRLPIVVYGKNYWQDVVNFEKIADWGMISHEDLKYFHFADSPDEAFDFLTQHLTELYLK